MHYIQGLGPNPKLGQHWWSVHCPGNCAIRHSGTGREHAVLQRGQRKEHHHWSNQQKVHLLAGGEAFQGGDRVACGGNQAWKGVRAGGRPCRWVLCPLLHLKAVHGSPFWLNSYSEAWRHHRWLFAASSGFRKLSGSDWSTALVGFGGTRWVLAMCVGICRCSSWWMSNLRVMGANMYCHLILTVWKYCVKIRK